MIVIQGDQPDHAFEAHVMICGRPHHAVATLYTTECPVSGEEGAARFPQTVRVAREVMGADVEALFGDRLRNRLAD